MNTYIHIKKNIRKKNYIYIYIYTHTHIYDEYIHMHKKYIRKKNYIYIYIHTHIYDEWIHTHKKNILEKKLYIYIYIYTHTYAMNTYIYIKKYIRKKKKKKYIYIGVFLNDSLFKWIKGSNDDENIIFSFMNINLHFHDCVTLIILWLNTCILTVILYIYIYILQQCSLSLNHFVANQVQYNMDSAQYLG